MARENNRTSATRNHLAAVFIAAGIQLGAHIHLNAIHEQPAGTQ